LLTTRGMEQMSTTREVAMSRINIWISVPAMRWKLRRLQKSDKRLEVVSVPKDVRRMNWRCMRMRAMHTRMLQITVTMIRKELKPVYM
ncbi:hypothetical protein N309_05083, partial [Tinamus guttatus]